MFLSAGIVQCLECVPNIPCLKCVQFLEQAFHFWNRELPFFECLPKNGMLQKWNELPLFAQLTGGKANTPAVEGKSGEGAESEPPTLS